MSKEKKIIAETGAGQHGVALAFVMKLAPTLGKDKTILLNFSGRGDKDIDFIVENYSEGYID